MGDRGNIVIRATRSKVYLYSHWTGYRLPYDAQKALSKRWRWDDCAYLARIVFDVMTDSDHGHETGFGIATVQQDYEYPNVVVDCKAQRIQFQHPGTRKILQQWSFEEYLLLTEKELECKTNSLTKLSGILSGPSRPDLYPLPLHTSLSQAIAGL